MAEHIDTTTTLPGPTRIDAHPTYGVTVRYWPGYPSAVTIYRHGHRAGDYRTARGVQDAVARYRTENESLCAADAWREGRPTDHVRCAFPLAPNGTCYAADHHHKEVSA